MNKETVGEMDGSNCTYYSCEDYKFYPDVYNLSKDFLDIPATNTDVANGPPPWAMSNSAQAAWSSAFGFMLFIAVGGNAIVMWIVIAHRRMRTVTNYFLVNLSLADLLMSVLNCLFNFIYMLKSDWIFGDWYCTINNFIANVTVAASIFTLTGISFDRYMAIVRPLEPRMSKKCSLLAIAAIWLAGMILGIPCLMYSSTVVYNEKYHLTACILVWPDGSSDVSKMDYIYQVVLFIVTYLMPIAGMSRCYWAMGRELWGSRSIGEHTQRQADAICRKRKVVRMFAAVVVIFAVCWLPYQLYFVYMHVDKSLMYWPYTQQMYLSFYWLAMGNAMVNPIIYYWMNNRFRAYFKRAVCGPLLVCRLTSADPGNTDSPGGLARAHSYSQSGEAIFNPHFNHTPRHNVHQHLHNRDSFFPNGKSESPSSERFYLRSSSRFRKTPQDGDLYFSRDITLAKDRLKSDSSDGTIAVCLEKNLTKMQTEL